MAYYSEDLIDEILASTDIVEVVNEYVPLKRRGANYLGLCPFHKEKTPSFTVSADKQIYKCFSCNAAGNVFTFVQEYEKIQFMDAVKKVCDLTGQKVEGFEKVIKKNIVSKEKQTLFDLLNDLTNFYSYNLNIVYKSLSVFLTLLFSLFL